LIETEITLSDLWKKSQITCANIEGLIIIARAIVE